MVENSRKRMMAELGKLGLGIVGKRQERDWDIRVKDSRKKRKVG